MPATLPPVDLPAIVAYATGLVLAYLLLRLFWLPARAVLRLGAAVALGAVAIGLINLVGSFAGIQVPLNAVSILGVGMLGIPGLLLVIALGTLL